MSVSNPGEGRHDRYEDDEDRYQTKDGDRDVCGLAVDENPNFAKDKPHET